MKLNIFKNIIVFCSISIITVISLNYPSEVYFFLTWGGDQKKIISIVSMFYIVIFITCLKYKSYNLLGVMISAFYIGFSGLPILAELMYGPITVEAGGPSIRNVSLGSIVFISSVFMLAYFTDYNFKTFTTVAFVIVGVLGAVLLNIV
ncbi:MAG: hypothetical protein HRU04_18620 [Oceanospirillaceae bacterium]|nr:hypothetical protein [Oceanospirillaceae bacterium]